MRSRLVFTDPLYFIWMYNRLSGQFPQSRVFAKFGEVSENPVNEMVRRLIFSKL